MNTITVTINPDGTAREAFVNPINFVFKRDKENYRPRHPRTFEIENVCNNCNGYGWYVVNSRIWGPDQEQCEMCNATGKESFQPGTTHTAEILPNNKVKILS